MHEDFPYNCSFLLPIPPHILQLSSSISGSPSNRRWFEQTKFETYQENHEEEPTYPAAYDYPQHRRIGYDKDVIVVDRSPEAEAQKSDLDVESVVEVKIRGESHYGVIKSLCTHLNWLDDHIAGIELEEPIIGGTDGSFEGTQYFTCGPRKAVFVYLSQCRPDSRFPTNADTYRVFTRETSLDFGNQESPIIPGYVQLRNFQQSSVGENKGIQGDQNSCYLDVSLYSMFSFNTTFDVSLVRPKEGKDVQDFEEIQTILREKIVNPLRENGFVRADRVRDLRLHLDKLGLLPGMTNEEKDPEEFLHMLVRDVLKAQPLIKTRHSDTKEIDSQYLYQIFMEKNDSLELPKVEQLLHQSFLDNELKLVEIPECLVVQMPRFGKDYKMYRRILPSLTIDITDLLENYPRSCTICGELAKVECRDCRPDEEISEEFIKSYCFSCCDMSHSSLPSHRIKQLTLNPEVEKGFELMTRTGQQLHFQRQTMELFAVVCIQTSHYVAFVKTETKPTHWVFFDSMADRDASTVPGFNIPKVTHLKNFEEWLKDPQRIINTPDDKKLPEHLRRLLGDAYICFYRKIGTEQIERTPREWASGATNY
nr:ubiquitin carboxyl-terminal hydrolase CYLD-like [Lytechinus pictus]